MALAACVAMFTRPALAQSPQALDRNILIADRGNNRIIEVTPDKQIVWEYHFEGLEPGEGADDAFFSPDNTKIIANLEYSNLVVIIDYATRKIVWQFGNYKPGSGLNELNSPDDAYLLPDGNVTVADIENCRVLVIAPDKHIVRQFGKSNQCLSQPNYLNRPNGATPLPNGNLLITEIRARKVSEVKEDGSEVYGFHTPAFYPSDAQPTKRGTIIVADYVPDGAIYELDRTGKVLWQYGPYGKDNERGLDRPSLAVEMPNGNIIANDDFNHRVVIIDKQTKKIIWQYGRTGIHGAEPGYLYIPDGLDWRHDGGALAAGIAAPTEVATANP